MSNDGRYNLNPQEDSLPIVGCIFKKGIVERIFFGDENDIDVQQYSPKPPGGFANCIMFKDMEDDSSTTRRETRDNLYAQPLLRGITDSVKKDDTILYTEIDNYLFWLGPINTTNNPGNTPTLKSFDEESGDDNYVTNVSGKSIIRYTDELDNAYKVFGENINIPYVQNGKFSDVLIEGRHNNSISLGANTFFPFIKIENNHRIESVNINEEIEFNKNNGSIFGMYSIGSIAQHIPNFQNLSCDIEIENYNKTKTTEQYQATYLGTGNLIPDEQRFKVDYSKIDPEIEASEQTEFDQIIMFSDRITFDAQDNDFNISSKRNINLGSSNNFTLNTKGISVIQSDNIYLGVESQKRTEPMVLGEQLRNLLLRIMELLQESRVLVGGVPIPLYDQEGSPMFPRIEKLISELQPRSETEVENGVEYGIDGAPFLSHHHYIEINRVKQNQEGQNNEG